MGYRFISEDINLGLRISSTGDVDGDGQDEILIASDALFNIGAGGTVYLIQPDDLAALDAADGTSDGIIQLSAVAGTGTSYVFVGQEGDAAGLSIASAGDVDNDGKADLMIGAPFADGIGNAESASGSVYLINANDLAALDAADGAADGVIDLGRVAGTGTSYEFIGENAGDSIGGGINTISSAGDVDGDGQDDLLIGASQSGGGAGKVYLIKAADFAALDLADGTEDGIIDLTFAVTTGSSYVFVGQDLSDALGSAVRSAGDVDNDGQADLLLAAVLADGSGNSDEDSGSVYLINADALAALDQADGTADRVINVGNVAAASASYEFVGRAADDFAGGSISAGDVDGDGRDDLLIGAPEADGFLIGPASQSGVAYLINANDLAALDGAGADGIISLAFNGSTGSPGVGTSYVFFGDRFDEVGRSVSFAGDVDGDGLADILIGAPGSDGIGNAATDVGSTYLISGADLVALDLADGTLNGRIDLDDVAGVGTSYEFVGTSNLDEAGYIVSSAGDVDGDNRDDLLISRVFTGALDRVINFSYLIEADRLAFYDGLDGAVDGVINLANVSCFLTGTRIATPGGPVAVERLGPGDLVLTADSRAVPVRFNLRQSVSTRFGPPERLMPVRLRAGALGQGLPVRDLVLTADHALMIDGLLINAGALVNGSSIDRVPLAELGESFTVYHIETADHDIILAEGTPAETFIDYAGRQTFDNYADYLALHGADRMIAEHPAPRITSARMLPPALKARLGLERAA